MRRSLVPNIALTLAAAFAVALASPQQAAAAGTGTSSGSRTVSALAAAPVAAVRLPAGLDAQPGYQAQVSCDPVSRAGTTALGQLLVRTYGVGTVGYQRYCSGGGTSEHYDGRALDWMVNAAIPAQRAAGDAFAAWISAGNGANARRLGVQYVIWNARMWRAYAPQRGWTAYSGSNPHTDHVHVSLTWDGALKRTSWWTGRALTTQDLGPCRVYAGQPAPVYSAARTTACPVPAAAPRTSYSTWVIGQRSPQIATGQRLLSLTADGQFGPGTRAAVLAYQRSSGLPVTGALDAATWVRLTSGSSAPAPAGPDPAASGNSTGASTQTARVMVITPLTAHKKTVLRPGDTGAPVSVLQRALGRRANGQFDAATRDAVVAVQRRWGLAATGVVDLRTWNRVEIGAYPWLPYAGTKLQAGSRGPAVSAVQRLLGLTPSGVFDQRTAYQLRGVKKRLGLAPTGVVDDATWAAFVRL